MRCFFAYMRQHFRSLTIFRFEYFTKILYGLLAMFAIKSLWTVLYQQSPALVGKALPEMITYAMLAMGIDMIFYPSGDNAPQTYMARQIRNGNIDTDFLKPMGFHRQMLYRNASRALLFLLLLVLPLILIAVLFLGMRLPASWFDGISFGISLILAYFVLFSMNFLIGLIAIVTKNIRYINWAYWGIVDIFSGKLIPLWIFPTAFVKVMQLLPFRCIYDIPLNIYIGSYSHSEIPAVVGLQLVWAVSLMVLSHLLWLAVRKHYTVQGG